MDANDVAAPSGHSHLGGVGARRTPSRVSGVTPLEPNKICGGGCLVKTEFAFHGLSREYIVLRNRVISSDENVVECNSDLFFD